MEMKNGIGDLCEPPPSETTTGQDDGTSGDSTTTDTTTTGTSLNRTPVAVDVSLNPIATFQPFSAIFMATLSGLALLRFKSKRRR